MPPKKKTKVEGKSADNEVAVTIHQLEDIVADILAWLCVEEIMSKRRVCKKWKEAVKKTVPLTDFCVRSGERCDAMRVMTRAMPNLQQIMIGYLGLGHHWRNGEDPALRLLMAGVTRTRHNIEIISNFNKLRILTIHNAPLNGRYPFLFNSFPLLQKLSIKYCAYLRWDLEMLAGLPVLKELECFNNHRLTGNINSLRLLEDTLEKVEIDRCDNVKGNFMDLADFLHLKELKLEGTAVIGDIRDVGENDFSSLEQLTLPKGVYCGRGYELQRISDAPELIRSVCLLKKQRPALKMDDWHGVLSEDSPDWYESVDEYDNYFPDPSFYICLAEAGSRLGYRRTNYHGYYPCEVNWLDPEPDRESSVYAEYVKDLQKLNSEVKYFKGFHQPPTEEEYNRLRDRFDEEGRWW